MNRPTRVEFGHARALAARVITAICALGLVMTWSTRTPNADAAASYRESHCTTNCVP